jgi:c-di-GMP-binding flagellar brake protein YcgR
MSEIFFSQQNLPETISKLSQVVQSKSVLTLWLKGKKEKYIFKALRFDKDKLEITIDNSSQLFEENASVLCSFELMGVSFFSEIIYHSSESYNVLMFKNALYKSERRSSFRLLTFPHHQVWATFDIESASAQGKVIDLKSRGTQTRLFRSFLKIIGDHESVDQSKLKMRVQDLSTTGMALEIGEVEAGYFDKGMIFQKVDLIFSDDTIQIPAAKIVYVVNYISNDRSTKKYKVGIHFENLISSIDDKLGRKINSLLRLTDAKKDFEKFLK